MCYFSRNVQEIRPFFIILNTLSLTSLNVLETIKGMVHFAKVGCWSLSGFLFLETATIIFWWLTFASSSIIYGSYLWHVKGCWGLLHPNYNNPIIALEIYPLSKVGYLPEWSKVFRRVYVLIFLLQLASQNLSTCKYAVFWSKISWANLKLSSDFV